ncbi:MAG: SUMF1/EgtB/PvdO family nonheme iron enzyme [Planctomycetaceae bacterium]|nr:SUMF1/EgtB/PvdO family nonheme iron enzyme [Planctomycetaceae bacterium]
MTRLNLPEDSIDSSLADFQRVLPERYRLLRELGRGGMGQVILAIDRGPFMTGQTLVAIKRLLGAFADDRKSAHAFLSELELTRSIRHPNVVRMFHCEITSFGPYIVMEYIDGPNLLEYIQTNGPLNEAQVTDWFILLCSALDEAHRQNIVHRDIKPTNILIDQNGKALLADFGIARRLNSSDHTGAGLGAGTLSYMSPEQIENRPPNASQDIYSLGATLFHAMEGKPPFIAATIPALIAAIMSHPPPSPTSPPSHLRENILRSLSKNPNERPRSCCGIIESTEPDRCIEKPQPIRASQTIETNDEPSLAERGKNVRQFDKKQPIIFVSIVLFVAVTVSFSVPLLKYLYPERSDTEAFSIDTPLGYESKREGSIESASELGPNPERKERSIAESADRVTPSPVGQDVKPEAAPFNLEANNSSSTHNESTLQLEKSNTPEVPLVPKSASIPESEDNTSLAKESDSPTPSLSQEFEKRFLGSEFHENRILSIRMIRIPKGTFIMGSSDEEREAVKKWDSKYLFTLTDEMSQQQTTIQEDFYCSIYEVTRGQFETFVDLTGYKPESELNRTTRHNWRSPGFPQAPNHPVVGVTWNDANEFSSWLTRQSQKLGIIPNNQAYRLPTEAEWEYAARAGTTTWYSFGDAPEKLIQYGNTADWSYSQNHNDRYGVVSGNDGNIYTSPVGSYEPNAFGVFDMHGNVFEWCLDDFKSANSGTSVTTDNTRRVGQRTIKGGSWGHGAAYSRSATRYKMPSSDHDTKYVGFRIILGRPIASNDEHRVPIGDQEPLESSEVLTQTKIEVNKSYSVRSNITRSSVYQNRSSLDPVDHRMGIAKGTDVKILEIDKKTDRLRVEWNDTSGVIRQGWIDATEVK